EIVAGWLRREGAEEGAPGRRQLAHRGPAGGAGGEVPLDGRPEGQVRLAGGEGEEDLLGGGHQRCPSGGERTERMRFNPGRMRDFKVPTGSSSRSAVSS